MDVIDTHKYTHTHIKKFILNRSCFMYHQKSNRKGGIHINHDNLYNINANLKNH